MTAPRLSPFFRLVSFDEIDSNRDGAIEFEEFYGWWTRD